MKTLLILLTLLVLAPPVMAQHPDPMMAASPVTPPENNPIQGVDDKAIISLAWENDNVAGNDFAYTNGVRFSYLSSEAVPEWLSSAARAFPLFSEDGRERYSFSIGQSMFTPEDISIRQLQLDDRPYAGFLYGSVGVISDTGSRLDNLELTLGIVGPESYAEQTQEFVHDLINVQDPSGWNNQLQNEPGVVLTYDRQWLARHEFGENRWGVDFTPHLGLSLGNVYTHAAGGAILRLGQDLPQDYGPPRIRPSLPGSDFFIPTDDLSWYLFFGAEGRAVGRNIFLDGNTFRDSHSVDKKYLVGEVLGGIAFTFEDTRIAYTHVLRSREFEGQDTNTQYGALTLTQRF